MLSYDKLLADVRGFTVPPEFVHMDWIAVSRGGLAFAQMLSVLHSKRLGFVDPARRLHMSSYFPTQATLLLDDVCRTGKTLQTCKEVLGRDNVRLFTYLWDPKFPEPDLYVIKTSDYVPFPWEELGPDFNPAWRKE